MALGVEEREQHKPAAHLVIVTEADSECVESLGRTADSLLGQSFGDWSWTILVNGELDAQFVDPRIRFLQSSSRPADLRKAVAGAQFVAFVDAGVELRELALEKWLWFLASHEECPGVSGVGLEDRARLYKAEAIDAAGGCDAVWATAGPLGLVPWTAAGHGPDRASNGSPTHRSSDRSRRWVDETIPFRATVPKRARQLMLIAPFMSLGGADRVNIEILRGLSDRGWGLTVATTRAADHALYPAYEAITTDLFPLADIVERFDIPRLLDYLIDSRRPDVVMISQSELGYRLLPYLRSRQPTPAFVDLCHSEHMGWYEGGFPRFSVEYGGLLDGTLVVSEHLRDWMVQHGAAAARVAVCHANVDHTVFAADLGARARTRGELGIAADDSVVLWVGRLSAEKRPALLPAISAALSDRGVRHTLLVVGDGPERSVTEAKAAAEGNSRLRFLGELDHASLPRIYAASDVVVLPSGREGIALTLYEAMSSGVPVVAANVGGHAELITPDAGILVDFSGQDREVNEYAAAVAAVLTDPLRRAAMALASRARIESQFTVASMHARFEQVLEDALEHHASMPVPVLEPRLARAVAAEAVELMRLKERGTTTPQPPRTGRAKAYAAVQLLGGPAYRWAQTRRVPGLRSARNVARRAIVGD